MRRFSTFLCLALSAGTVFADDVPKVDIRGVIVVTKPATRAQGFDFSAQRIRMIQLPNGKQRIPLREFMLTYCQGKYSNETCARGSKILSIDSSSGPREQLPADL
ncbi:hypothetical protein [Cupriavidus basilensis]|uniref:hypothetical protein n=1 Tax=Cupriavidus basilensis TaxID=68895 RepID=UPI0005BDE8F0|nr:hypothetical protein [Cupriavidus basilensis]